MKPIFHRLDNIFVLIIEALKESLQIDYGEYENLNLSGLSLSRIRAAVIAVFIGSIIGIYASLFNKKIYGRFVRALGNESCFTPESAKTLKELGFLKSPSIRYAIRRGTVYKDTICCPDEEEYRKELEQRRGVFYAKVSAGEYPAKSKFKVIPFKYDFETAKFYIPENKIFEAEEKFKGKSVPLFLLIILTVTMIAALYVTIAFLPDILMLINNFVGMFSTSIN